MATLEIERKTLYKNVDSNKRDKLLDQLMSKYDKALSRLAK